MWSGILNGSSMGALEQTIQFAERRHSLLATNIANADTPGYQTRDLSVKNFQQSLKEAIAATNQAYTDSQQGVSGADSTNPIVNLSTKQAMENVRESMKQIMYHDGSDVGLETQVTEISKNQSMHSMAIAILRNQHQLMKMAITESVNV